MRARFAVLAVLAVVAVAGWIAMLGVTAITVSGEGHEAEVRITAQRLADGRTEFALQQREADGAWSERLLPRGRFFPATPTVGRWLSSTPLAVRSLGPDDDAEGSEVRITAQRLADGRTEFALQEREADGGWGERLLPEGRFFPTTATVGRWLSSTPLTVSLPEVPPDTAEDGGSVASDRAALVALYNATEGARWITSTNWLSDRPLDEWHGVTTNSDGHVAELDLINNQLTGPIPAALGDLTNLESLVLLYNGLTGPIPAELGDLTKLESLWLGDNQLTGPIPAELGDLTNLESLWLGGNQLTGPIPAWLGALTKLESLHLWGNQLTGPIPAWLGTLTNLESLLLHNSQLTGPIPAELGTLTKLESLWLQDNQLTGPIPAWLGTLTSLQHVIISNNQLTGPIPAELGDLTNLRTMDLGGNELTGAIPADLGDLTNLEGLGLWGNQLTGPIPAELGGLSNLGRLLLNGNQLTGPIPAELGELTNLVLLWLSGNELTGCVPAGFRDVARNDVAQLDLLDCVKVSPDTAADGGSVASDRAALVALYNATGGASWRLSTNWLSDRPLNAWDGVTTNSDGRVAGLDLFNNQLTGPIPAELGDLTRLRELELRSTTG